MSIFCTSLTLLTALLIPIISLGPPPCIPQQPRSSPPWRMCCNALRFWCWLGVLHLLPVSCTNNLELMDSCTYIHSELWDRLSHHQLHINTSTPHPDSTTATFSSYLTNTLPSFQAYALHTAPLQPQPFRPFLIIICFFAIVSFSYLTQCPVFKLLVYMSSPTWPLFTLILPQSLFPPVYTSQSAFQLHYSILNIL